MDNKYSGLSTVEVEERTRQGLVNIARSNVSKTRGEIVRSHTLTYFNILNLFLAALVIFSGQIKNMTFMVVVIFNAAIGIGQEIKVKKIIDKLSVITASKAKVIRDGKTIEIPVDQVVMDDHMLVENGDQVCSDSEVLDSQGIEVNESMLTGESKPVKKKPGDKLMSGSFLVAGSGICKVEHVGDENYATVLAKQAKTKKRASSEMQRNIRNIIKFVSILIVPVGIFLFISQSRVPGTTLSQSLVGTVAGVIGMIPEGLVLLTSISFILGVGRLAKKKALVQEMEAIEALARVNILCCDKTGTITTGDLKVKEVLALGDKTEQDVQDVMNELSFAFDDVNVTQNALMTHFKNTKEWVRESVIPFSSDRKYRAISFADKGSFVLGAPEFLIGDNEALGNQVNELSEKGFRVLLLGECESIDTESGEVSGVQPMGLIVITDCIRPTARATFDYFRERKVAIKVISGDNPVTVSHIAVEAGLKGGENYIDANELPEDIDELKKVVEKYSVFGRVRPEQKQRIIKAYQSNGDVVGMVGDGVNDVLALKDADCGIAMAAGSDAAKEVAHIVLMDSDFASMKSIVDEGRLIIGNIEKVSALYLTKTLYSVFLCVIFIIMDRKYPFIPIQLSLISATTIGIPSFFLALDRRQSKVSQGFLKHVVSISLPCALGMFFSLVFVQLMMPLWNSDPIITSTVNLLIGGAIGICVLVKVCRQMTVGNLILVAGMAGLFALGPYIAPAFLGVNYIFTIENLYAIPLIGMAFWITETATRLLRRGYRLQKRTIKNHQSLFDNIQENKVYKTVVESELYKKIVK